MKCRYHFRTESTERCHHCGVALCEECAKPVVCLNCGKPKVEKARTAERTAPAESPKKRKKAKARPQKRIGPSLKAGRTFGWIAVCAFLLLSGGWAWGNFSRLGQELDKHLKNQLALRKQMKAFSELTGGKGGVNDDLEAYLERFDKDSRKKGRSDETEKLMAQLQGESAPSEEDKGAKSRMPGQVDAVLRKNAPRSTKIWRFSDHPIASRRLGYAVGGPAQWKIRITSPKAGQKLSGTITVCAQLDVANAVSRAELLVDGKMDAIADHPPFRFEWATEGYDNGKHSIKVLVYDPAGGVHASSKRTVNVKN